MRVYRVFPNFLRQREQRVGGLLTIPQTLVGLAALLALVAAVRISLWLAAPVVALGGLALVATAPVEGEIRLMRWLVPLRLWVARETLDHFVAFPTGARQSRQVVPLMVRHKGQIVLSADVPAETRRD